MTGLRNGQYESIIINVDYFAEGKFWNVVPLAYADDKSTDDPKELETDWRETEQDAIETAEFFQELWLGNLARRVTILKNGTEYNCKVQQ